jgi:hypothetical protein
MAVTAFAYGQGLVGQYGTTSARRVDWDADTIKTALHTSGYTQNIDSDDFFNDAVSEITGTGYTAGGFTHTTSAVSLDSGSDTVRLDADDAAWTSASFSADNATVYKDTGNSTTAPLMAYVDFGATETVSSGTFTIQWDSTGVIVLDYTP